MDLQKYKCYICLEELHDLPGAMKHLRSHGVENEETLQCMKAHIPSSIFCDSKFKSYKALRQHMNGNNCTLLCSDTVVSDGDTQSDVDEHSDGEAQSDSYIHQNDGDLMISNCAEEWHLENEFGQLCLKNTPEDNAAGGFTEFMDNFFDKLNSYNLPHDTLSGILALSKNLVSKTTEINKVMLWNNPNEPVSLVLNSTNDLVASSINKYATRFKREKDAKKVNFLSLRLHCLLAVHRLMRFCIMCPFGKL